MLIFERDNVNELSTQFKTKENKPKESTRKEIIRTNKAENKEIIRSIKRAKVGPSWKRLK